jgi:hypothetical protein
VPTQGSIHALAVGIELLPITNLTANEDDIHRHASTAFADRRDSALHEHAAVSEISLCLMEKIIEARQAEQSGESHLIRRGLAVPEKLIDWIICCSLDALSWNDHPIVPRDLIVLIRERLGGSNTQYEQEGEVRRNKLNAGAIAGQLFAHGVTPTFKLLGQALGVSPSTVKRWFGPGELEKARDSWASLCDKDGKLLPLDRIGK